MPFARGELMQRILWRTRTQKPTSARDVPSLEIGLAARPLPRAVRANPSFVPAQGRYQVIGAPGDGNADRTAGFASTTAMGDDPVGAASFNPDVKHGLQIGLGVLSAVPGIGLVAGILGRLVGMIPSPATSPATSSPTAADNPEPGSGPTGSSAGISADRVAAAQAALNDGIAAMAVGDTTRGLALIEQADRLAGGVLGLSASDIAANRAGAASATSTTAAIDLGHFAAIDSITQAQADQIVSGTPGDAPAGSSSSGGTGAGIDSIGKDPTAGAAASGVESGDVETSGGLGAAGADTQTGGGTDVSTDGGDASGGGI